MRSETLKLCIIWFIELNHNSPARYPYISSMNTSGLPTPVSVAADEGSIAFAAGESPLLSILGSINSSRVCGAAALESDPVGAGCSSLAPCRLNKPPPFVFPVMGR